MERKKIAYWILKIAALSPCCMSLLAGFLWEREYRHSHSLLSIGLDLVDSSEHFCDIFAGILSLDICYSSSQALEGILARGAESARSGGRHFAGGWNYPVQLTRGSAIDR